MPLGRRHEGREERRRGGGQVHYKMRERLMSIGDDYWIETDSGERAYKVDGKALRLRKTLILEDAAGHELAKIRERVLRVKDAMEVEDPEGNRLAMIKKALISPLRDRWSVEISGGPDLDVQGTSSTTSTRSRMAELLSQPSRRSGSEPQTRTGWRSRPAKTLCPSWLPRLRST